LGAAGHRPAVGLCLEAIDANLVVFDEAVFAALEEEARARSLRDPNDWPVVASARALAAGVWTNDNDVLGTGVPTWTTETLQAWLDRNDEGLIARATDRLTARSTALQSTRSSGPRHQESAAQDRCASAGPCAFFASGAGLVKHWSNVTMCGPGP
jgi:hypothetical protein